MNPQDHLLWLDLETTGSNEEYDSIIEIGCVLSTADLDPINEFTALVQPNPMGLGRMMQNPIVRAMHEKNGLLKAVMELTVEDKPHVVTNNLLDWLMVEGAERGKTVLAGSGVGHFDRRFIAKYMPKLHEYLRYWVIDIGVIRRAHEMWVGTPPGYAQSDTGAHAGKTHRALDDARCHLEEAQVFRAMWNNHD